MKAATASKSKPQPYALAHALAYAAMGWPVLPLAPGDKKPALPGHGFKDATTDSGTIARWFEQMPGAGVGIHPGPAGLLVLDIDDKPGKPCGADSLADLETGHEPLPATLTQRTPSGGRAFHLVYSLPVGFDAASIGNATLAPGIDVRSAAGYIGAEPTRVILTGGGQGGYAFDDWDVTAGELPDVAPAPAWLLALLAAPTIGQRQQAGDGQAATSAREFVTPQQVAELRSALNALDAEPYEGQGAWVPMGIALSGLGNIGRELWMTWSQQSDKFNPSEAAAKWRTFKADRTGYAAVFKAAQAAGWVNPSSRAAALPGGPPGAAAGTPQQPARPPFRVVPVADLDTATVPPQVWLWDGYIPAGALTLFGAHGGAGKSTIALMLAVSAAVGLALFGVDTKPARVLFFSAEDDADTVRRRLQNVCRTLGVSAASLADRLRILDASDGEPVLFDEPRTSYVDGVLVVRPPTTPTYNALAAAVKEWGAELLIVDNASDTYGGNEIARKEVCEFVRSLAALVRKQGGAVCLLAHTDKNTAKGFGGGQSYSGSTAWHNSARSRLALRRDKGGDLVLEHEKSNYGPTREPLRLVWPRDGLPEADAPTTGVVLRIATDNNTQALLRLVHEFMARGESVTTATSGPGHAGLLLRGQPGFPQALSSADVFDLLRQAQRRGWLARCAYVKTNRHPGERWEITDAGAAAAGLAPVAPVAPVHEIGASSASGATGLRQCASSGAGGVGVMESAGIGAEAPA